MAFNPNSLSETTIKRFVDKLVQQNKKKETWPPKRAVVQEDVAVMLGYKNWHELSKSVKDIDHNTLEKNINNTQTAENFLYIDVPELQTDGYGADLFCHPPLMSNRGSYFLEKTIDYTPSASMKDIVKHSLVYGADEKRLIFFESMISNNPHVRFMVIQGSQSLPLPSTKNIAFSNVFFDDDQLDKAIHQIPTDFLTKYILSQKERKQLNEEFVVFFTTVYQTILKENIVAFAEGKEQKSLYYYIPYFNYSSDEFKTVYNVMSTQQKKMVTNASAHFSHKTMVDVLQNLCFKLPNLPKQMLPMFEHNIGLNVTGYEHETWTAEKILLLLEYWRLSSDKPGVVIFNGIHHTSRIWHIYPHFSRVGQNNIGVFVGGHSGADLPNDPKEHERLTSRLTWRYPLR